MAKAGKCSFWDMLETEGLACKSSVWSSKFRAKLAVLCSKLKPNGLAAVLELKEKIQSFDAYKKVIVKHHE